jgi:hypothetical protein
MVAWQMGHSYPDSPAWPRTHKIVPHQKFTHLRGPRPGPEKSVMPEAESPAGHGGVAVTASDPRGSKTVRPATRIVGEKSLVDGTASSRVAVPESSNPL